MSQVATISVRPELLARIFPWRAIQGSARPEPDEKILDTLRKQWSAQGGRDKTYRAIFEAGLESTRAPLLEPARAAVAFFSEPSVEKLSSLDDESLAAAERISHFIRATSLTPMIARASTLARAVSIAVRAAQLRISSDRGYGTAVQVAPETREMRYYSVDPIPFVGLRHAIAAAPNDVYDAARERAVELRAEGDEWDRRLLSFVFPDEPWGNEELAAGLQNGTTWFYCAAAASDPALLERMAADRFAGAIADYAFDVAARLRSEDATRVLETALRTLLTGAKHKTPPRQIAQALALMADAGAARVLAPHAANKVIGSMVVEFFRAHPELAPQGSKGRAGAVVARVLEKREQRESDQAEEASLEVAPAILRERPWRKKPSTSTFSIALDTLGLELAFVDESVLPPPLPPRGPSVPISEEKLATWEAERAKEKGFLPVDAYVEWIGGRLTFDLVPPELGLVAWNEGVGHVVNGEPSWVRAHGLATVPGFIKRDWLAHIAYDPELATFAAVRALVDPRIAPSIARAAFRKRTRRAALAWLMKHAEIAAYGLVPVALGPAGDARTTARDALFIMAEAGRREAIEGVARAYGEPAREAIGALLARDPLALGAKSPKVPTFLHETELPPLKLRDGRVLPSEARSALLEMLQVAPLDPPYAGIALVRNACDAESLGAITRELIEQWVLGDAPGRHDWMLFSAVHFPSLEGTRRVASLAREWARQSAAKAGRVCVALAEIGSDLALMHLGAIAETTRFDALSKDTKTLVEEAAAARGLTRDELEDRTVPDCGLDESGTMTLSLGARTVVVSVGESGELVVRERLAGGELGTPSKSLPRARKDDDPAISAESRARFKGLSKDVESVAKRQIQRLERAMIVGRTWSKVSFDKFVVKHPLVRSFARGLVWCTADGTTFRVTEDDTYANVRDDALTLTDDATISIAHPARNEDLAHWANVFSDYEIVQPFQQLGRSISRPLPGPQERSLEWSTRTEVPARKLLGVLESRGWSRNDATHVSAYERVVRTRSGELGSVVWSITPGFALDNLDNASAQAVGAVELRPESGVSSFAELDRVELFELLRDIDAVLRV